MPSRRRNKRPVRAKLNQRIAEMFVRRYTTQTTYEETHKVRTRLLAQCFPCILWQPESGDKRALN